ncbi:IclR family transcriptional regulator [Herbiconiux ginsengi]|uniref:Transcriptional regulator, IclR family n=1 Tax=Herbiconiux ginsengi TaxID=381665 RepID=A0A1H3U2H8_9MICO|nr:helix-turn-helix domain-containing protein [Herbiconiux ginsengi]SDZ55729.1 transcriptional regulator, IclR family [Herbiconiux ginsengi]
MRPQGALSGVALALGVLEEVARSGPTLTANGIARTLEVPRASAYRMINSLVAEEYLLRHPTLGGFVLGARVQELAHLVAPPTDSPTAEILDSLRQRTGEAVHLVRYSRGRVVIADEDELLPLSSIDRTRRQLGSTAIGRLLLASVPSRPGTLNADPVVETVARTARSSGISLHEHRLIVEEVETNGFAQHIDLGAEGRACVAVPIKAPQGELLACIALAVRGPEPESALRHVPTLLGAAHKLAHATSTGTVSAIR